MALVRDVEAPIDSYENIEVDDNNLDSEVEDVEACFVLVICRVGDWPFPTCEVDTYTERCTCAEKKRRQEQNCYLVPESPAAELLHTGLARYDEPSDDKWDGEEGDDRVESLTIELNIAVDALRVQVECIGGLDDGSDECDQTEDDDDIYGCEKRIEDRMPAGIWMTGSDYALGEDDVDNKE